MDGSVSSTRVTVGGGGDDSLDTATVTGSEVNWRPSASRATAVKVWNPLPVVVSQETEYGGLKSSAPRLTPSSLNWTPATRIPAGLKLARTVIVSETFESEAGSVMVTTRPPGKGGKGRGGRGRGGSCAQA